MPRLPNTSPQTLSVLQLLLESPRSWHYGYALSQLTGLKSGTLYPILLRLADQRWLETRWAEPEQPGRPRAPHISPDRRRRKSGANETR